MFFWTCGSLQDCDQPKLESNIGHIKMYMWTVKQKHLIRAKKLQIEYQVFNLGSNKALIEVTYPIWYYFILIPYTRLLNLRWKIQTARCLAAQTGGGWWDTGVSRTGVRDFWVNEQLQHVYIHFFSPKCPYTNVFLKPFQIMSAFYSS